MTVPETKTRALLLDIEGTVTPISFVHDILFPFARAHARDYLIRHSTTAEVVKDTEALFREYLIAQEKGERPPQIHDGVWSLDSIIAYVNWLIEHDRKSPALKSLQGKIWEQGYRNGSLKAPLFDDVVPNLQRLRQERIGIAIFSSGSVLAQRLLFAHTETGNHTDLLDQYFDTEVGSKVEAESYERIAQRLMLSAAEIIFVSDVTTELKAAREAGMATLLCVRPGNQPQSASGEFEVIHSFSEILSAA